MLRKKELVVISENSYNLCEGGKGGFSYINENNLNFGGDVKKASANGHKSLRKKYGSSTYHLNKDIDKKKEHGKWLFDHIKRNKLGIFKPENKISMLGKKHSEETKKILYVDSGGSTRRGSFSTSSNSTSIISYT